MIEFVNEIIENIWKDRYCKDNETVEDNFKRVAKFCAKNEEEEKEFFEVMSNGLFFPGGRTMSNAGIGKSLTLNNCFTAPQIEDDLNSIFESVTLGARTHQRGGGIGYDFSKLRPKGTRTSNDAVASGAVSFMDVFDAQTATILQGNRRGANMGVMSVYDIDIEDFVTAKSKDPNKLTHFNISVMVDEEFINAVRNDSNIFLHFPVYDSDGKIEKDSSKWSISKEISAKQLWELITRNAYNTGEPGIMFGDNMNRDNPLYYRENIVCSNPCSEYIAGTVYNGELSPKEYGGACNLGSLMLHRFVEHPFSEYACVDCDKLNRVIDIAVKMLDNIIDVNSFPDKIFENYQKSLRTIGLGVTGLGDMLVMLNMKYDSDEARQYVSSLMDHIALHAYQASIELAKRRGSFPLIDKEKHSQCGFISKHYDDSLWKKVQEDIKTYGIRNGKILSVAPCGTMSIVFGNNCSSGIEPIFSLSYERKLKIGGQSDDDIHVVKMMDYAYGEWLKVKDEPWCVVKEDVFVTALNMSVDDHLYMLGRIANNIDMSVSKTINVPTDYSFEDTQNIYMTAHDLGIKGCTIFRPNELRQGIFITESKPDKKPTCSHDCVSLNRGEIISTSDNLIGKKRKLVTGCGSLHCEAFFNPENGDLLEVFLSKGSTGGCLSNQTGLSRMMSLALRSGCTVQDVVDQLESAPVCPSYAVRTATKHDTSKGVCCPSAVAKALMDMWNEMQQDMAGIAKKCSNVHKIQNESENNTKAKCPECGETLVFEGGCNVCKNCGWSKCG